MANEHHKLEQSVASHISETGHIPKSLLAADEYHSPYHDDHEGETSSNGSTEQRGNTNYVHLLTDSDSDDTLVTASIFNSPSESLQDLNCIPIAPYEKLSPYNSLHESFKSALDFPAASHKSYSRSASPSDDDDISDDTLVDGVSIASSCTYVSEGGDAYKCAKGEFFFTREENDWADLPIDLPYDDEDGTEIKAEVSGSVLGGR